MSEMTVLYGSLGLAYVLTPALLGRLFAPSPRWFFGFHGLALSVLAASFLFSLPLLTLAWPIFCLFLAISSVLSCPWSIFSMRALVCFIPLAFSLISSLWFVCGINDFRLLGYDPTWSLYAALHSGFIGWLFLGSVARLAQGGIYRKFYTGTLFLGLLFFLSVAFGINGVPYVKTFGVLGLFALVPAIVGIVGFFTPSVSLRAQALARLSFFSLVFTMTVALANHFGFYLFPVLASIPPLVAFHGLINAWVAVPAFALAVWFVDPGSGSK